MAMQTKQPTHSRQAAPPVRVILREVHQRIECGACYRPFRAGDAATLSPERQPYCERCAELLRLSPQAKPRTLADLAALPPVRVFSMAGPCLTAYRFVKPNRTTYKLAYQNGDRVAFRNEWKGGVHVAPCPSCTDHPHTQYPHGYLD
jgi:hypothetical protein